MKSWNGENGEQASSEDVEHWKVQQRFEEEANMKRTGQGERIKLFRNEMSLHMLHTSVGFNPMGGDPADGNAVDGSFLW